MVVGDEGRHGAPREALDDPDEPVPGGGLELAPGVRARLFERRLQCNWYDEEEGALHYVPGFHALDHVCGM